MFLDNDTPLVLVRKKIQFLEQICETVPFIRIIAETSKNIMTYDIHHGFHEGTAGPRSFYMFQCVKTMNLYIIQSSSDSFFYICSGLTFQGSFGTIFIFEFIQKR